MDTTEALEQAFEQIRGRVHATVRGLSAAQLAWRPDAESNSIAWLVWHLTRVQDDHGSEIAGREQTWTADGWAERFGLPADYDDMGFGHDADDVARIRPDGHDVLDAYHDAVADATLAYLGTVGAEDLDRVVDRSWDPPVTAGVRLLSVIGDDLQHVGQAAYVRGLAERAGV